MSVVVLRCVVCSVLRMPPADDKYPQARCPACGAPWDPEKIDLVALLGHAEKVRHP